MKISFDSDFPNFQAPKISIESVRPSATILKGAGDTETVLAPRNSPGTFKSSAYVPALGRTNRTEMRWARRDGLVLIWRIDFADSGHEILLTALVENGSAEAIRLRDISPLHVGRRNLRLDGPAEQWWLLPISHNDQAGHMGETVQSLNEIERRKFEAYGKKSPYPYPDDPRHNDGRWRSLRDAATLYSDGGTKGVTLGFVGGEAYGQIDCFVEKTRLAVDAVCGMNDVIVDPGETRSSDTLLIAARPYQEALDVYFDLVAENLGSRIHRPPAFGWCSWYDRYRNIDEGHILKVAKHTGKLPASAAFETVQIDDGYQRAPGDWRCDPKRFPNGWKKLVPAIRRTGATPGIWIAPLLVHDSTGLIEKHPDWFQRNRDGELAGPNDGWGPTSYWLDPTHPGAQTFIREIIRDARRAGFRYFKIDFNCVGGHPMRPDKARMHDPRKTTMQAFRDLYRLYREEIGEDGYLLACVGFFHRGTAGFADACRIGMDTPPRWFHDVPHCLSKTIRHVASSAAAHRKIQNNDPDVSYTLPRDTLSRDELQTWHSFVGLLGGMSLISEPIYDKRYTAAESIRMLEILHPPVFRERVRSFDGATDPAHRRFGFVADRPWETFAALTVYNPTDAKADLSIGGTGSAPADEIGKRFHLWSFWDETYLGIQNAKYRIRNLPPHACRLLRLTPVSSRPTIIGSTLHISMGAAEIENLSIQDDRIVVDLVPSAGAAEGELMFSVDGEWILDEAIGCRVSKEIVSEESILCVRVEGRDPHSPQRIVLRKD